MSEMLEVLVVVIVTMLIDLVGLQTVTGTCSHRVLCMYSVHCTKYSVRWSTLYLLKCWRTWGKLGLYSSDGLEICTVHSHCRMSVRTCGLDLSERILDAGIHWGISILTGFYFLLDFDLLFCFVLFWLGYIEEDTIWFGALKMRHARWFYSEPIR